MKLENLYRRIDEETWVKNKNTGARYKVKNVDASKHEVLRPEDAQQAEVEKEKYETGVKGAEQAHKEKGVGGVPTGRVAYEAENFKKLMEYLKKPRAEVDNVDADDFDLCTVQIEGTNLFCSNIPKSEEHPDGIPRQDMPQLKGIPVPGSKAASIYEQEKKKMDADSNYKSDLINVVKNPEGSEEVEVSAENAFREQMKDDGYPVTRETVNPATLRSTQAQLVGKKIAGMSQVLKGGPEGNPRAYKAITDPIFVSEDGYILDGHHRWASIQAHNIENPDNPISMKIERVSRKPGEEQPMDSLRMVELSNKFADDFGISQAGFAKKKEPEQEVQELIPGMGVEAKDWTPKDQKKAVDILAKKTLKELRRQQEIVRGQIKVNYKDASKYDFKNLPDNVEKAGKNLDMMDRIITAAVMKKEF